MSTFETFRNDSTLDSTHKSVEEKDQWKKYDTICDGIYKVTDAFFRAFPKDNLADSRVPWQVNMMKIKTPEYVYDIELGQGEQGWYVSINYKSWGKNYSISVDGELLPNGKKQTSLSVTTDNSVNTHIKWSWKWNHPLIDKVAISVLINLKNHLQEKLQIVKDIKLHKTKK